jgi:hypothetical protein
MGGLERVHAFLVQGAPEDSGYALYNYLLLPGPPASGGKQHARLAIAEFLRLAAGGVPVPPGERARASISYLPLTRTPRTTTVDSVLHYYDHQLAQRLLRRFPGERTDGAYLASLPGPALSSRGDMAAADTFAIQDLGRFPEPLVEPAVGYYLRLADQQRFDGGPVLSKVVLEARTAIGVVALGLPDVARSMTEWRKLWAGWVTTGP